MADQTEIQALQVRERIALATAAAMFIAGVLLVTAILPAEYGVDPVGTGRVFGLTQIAQPAAAAAEAAEAAGTELEPVRPGANVTQGRPFKRNDVTFKLGPDEGLEYKYQMDKGSSMVYAWKSTGKVEFDFHGEPKGSPKGYAESYEMGESTAANGAFFAPTEGIHGWYWKNLTTDNITVTLTSAGFYTAGIEFTAAGRVDRPIPD